MLDKIKLFTGHAKKVVSYAKKAIEVLHTAVNAWPVWDSDSDKSASVNGSKDLEEAKDESVSV